MPASKDFIVRVPKDSPLGVGLRRLAELRAREPEAQMMWILRERLTLDKIIDDPEVFPEARRIQAESLAKRLAAVEGSGSMPSLEAQRCRCPDCLHLGKARGLCMKHYNFVKYHYKKTKRLSEAWLVRTGRLAAVAGVEDYGADFEPVLEGRDVKKADARWFFGLGGV